jgi:hypothetical protein
MRHITLKLTWKPVSAAATLQYVFDNDKHAPVQPKSGKGSVEVSWSSSEPAPNVLEWGLVFPGKTLTDLEAKATADGGAAKTLAESDSETHAWDGHGVLP